MSMLIVLGMTEVPDYLLRIYNSHTTLTGTFLKGPNDSRLFFTNGGSLIEESPCEFLVKVQNNFDQHRSQKTSPNNIRKILGRSQPLICLYYNRNPFTRVSKFSHMYAEMYF